MLVKQMSKTSLILIIFSIVGTTLLAFTYDATFQKIKDNERKTLLRNLNQLIPPHLYDNDLDKDKIELVDKPNFGHDKPVIIYRARKQNQAVAVVFKSIAPDGYNGKLHFLVGIKMDGSISGVRVISHKETPGLGDAVELIKSQWIKIFDDKSLNNPEESKWKVRRDRGQFDQITSATITSRALVKAVKRCLVYFKANEESLFR